MSSNIQGKTIRPGGLRYTYYQSGVKNQSKPKKAPKKKGHFKGLLFVVVLIIAAPIAYSAAATKLKTPVPTQHSSITTTTPKTAPQPIPATPAVAAKPNECATNQLSKDVIVSISQQHLWVCSYTTEEYDSAVVTGDEQHADTLTPPGTYHIYAMETNRTLTGSDENGSWNDFVYYWMPFLYNQYGAYGFHDATWRNASEFGNVDINTANASNGCVELPLATAKWLYNWADVGTTVTIKS